MRANCEEIRILRWLIWIFPACVAMAALCLPDVSATRQLLSSRWMFLCGNAHFIALGLSLALCYVFYALLGRVGQKHDDISARLEISEVMLDSGPTHMWFLSDPDHYGGANVAHAMFVGVSRDKLPGMDICMFLPEGDADQCRLHNSRVFEHGQTVTTEEWRRDAQDNLRLLGITRIPRKDANGRVMQVVCIASDITEKHMLQQEFNETQERLQMLMDAIPDPIQYKDDQGRWLYANKACLDVLGLIGVNYSGKTDREILTNYFSKECSVLADCEISDEDVWNSREVRVYTEQIVKKNNFETDYYDVLKKPIFYPDESRKGLIIVCRKINRLVHARIGLQKEHDTLEAILEAIPYLVFVHDSNLNIINYFAHEDSLLYAPREAFLGKKIDSILPQYLAERLSRSLDKVVRERAMVREEYELELGGLLKSFAVKIVPYGFEGALSVVEDVTETKELGRQFKVMQEAIEKSPAIFVITDHAEKIKYVNQAFCDVTGYKKEDVFGKKPNILKSGIHGAGFYREMWKTLNSGKSWRGEICNQRADGEMYWEDAIIVPIKDEFGKISTYVAIKYDITKKKKQESLLEEHCRIADELSKAKTEFMSMMSHELRTPLNGMLGIIQCMKESQIDSEFRAQLDMAEQIGFGLARVLADILYFSGASQEVETYRVDFDPGMIVKDMVIMFKSKAQEKNIEFNCENCFINNIIVNSDDKKLRYILFALISNAIKFTEFGSVSIKCNLDCNNKKIEFSINDTGIGINSKDIDKIFDPFTQIDGSMTRRYNGVGLGLTLVKKFLEQLNGDIKVQSSVGVGSVFEVSIPVILKNFQENAPGYNNSERIFKVLYAEDDLINQLAMKSFMRKKDIIIDCVENGLIAVNTIKENYYDVILMDINMPVMDGIEAMIEIRAIENSLTPRNVPIIAVTAYSDEHDKERFYNLGFTEFFAKPVNFNNLYSYLINVIND